MKRLILFFILLCLAAPQGSAAPGANQEAWKPVDPAHLALKTPTVEKDADAEILFWDVHVQSQGDGAAISHYIRIKIFTERGRESQSKVEFVFPEDQQIKDVAGRTIKADGTIVPLPPETIYERLVVRARKLKLKSLTFAMPGVEPGALIEYRWREVYKSFPVPIHLQKEIPAQSVVCYLPKGINGRYFNARRHSVKPGEKQGSILSLANVPALRKEPHMPPVNEVVSWLLITRHSLADFYSPSTFWNEYGRAVYEEYKSGMKVSDEVRRAAAEVIGDASTPEQKLERLFDYCRSTIKNIEVPGSGMSADELGRWKENKSPADTLRRRMGTGRNINMLFASLASAAGFDARYAVLAGRDRVFLKTDKRDYYFLDSYDIAVWVGKQWRFFDPASPYVPYGMLRWQEEGVNALICDAHEAFFATTPISPPEKSRKQRTAKLRLSEDGTLEGEVRIEFTGHFAAETKNYYAGIPLDEREKEMRESLKEWLGGAEINDIRIENVTDLIKPFVYSCRVRIPGYAERTGKRLFLRPGFFQYRSEPRFPASERRYPVYFFHPWQEEDTVTVELPAGYALENAESPAPVTAREVSKYGVRIGVSQDGRTLEYKRALVFGNNSPVLFSVSDYVPLKRLFDAIHERDTRTLALKQKEIIQKPEARSQKPESVEQ